jgi:hypothetical protein
MSGFHITIGAGSTKYENAWNRHCQWGEREVEKWRSGEVEKWRSGEREVERGRRLL